MPDYQPMSAPPPEGGGRPQPVEAPPSIRTAVNIVWAIVAMSVLSLLLTFVYFDDIVDAATTGTSESQRDAARIGAIIGTVFFSVVLGVLWVVMGIFLRKGKSWARIVLTILAVFGVLGGLVGLFGDRPALLTVVGVMTVLLEIALLFFLWRRDSSAYLQAGAQPR